MENSSYGALMVLEGHYNRVLLLELIGLKDQYALTCCGGDFNAVKDEIEHFGGIV